MALHIDKPEWTTYLKSAKHESIKSCVGYLLLRVLVRVKWLHSKLPSVFGTTVRHNDVTVELQRFRRAYSVLDEVLT